MSDTNYLYIQNHKKLNEMDNDIHLKYSLDDRYIFIVQHPRDKYDVHLLRNGEDGCWDLEIQKNLTTVQKRLNKRDIQHLPTFIFWLNSTVREWIIEDKKKDLIFQAHPTIVSYQYYGVKP